jgi:hypothetical protein
MAESSAITVSGRRSREETERLLVEFEQSGMTRQAFCREKSIALHTLDYYRHKHKNRAKSSVARLLQVELVGPLPPRSCCSLFATLCSIQPTTIIKYTRVRPGVLQNRSTQAEDIWRPGWYAVSISGSWQQIIDFGLNCFGCGHRYSLFHRHWNEEKTNTVASLRRRFVTEIGQFAAYTQFRSTFLRTRRITENVPPTITVDMYASQNMRLPFYLFDAVHQFTNVCLARIHPQEGGRRP